MGWTAAKNGRIGFGQYAGLEHALEERANQVYDRLTTNQQAAAKRLFMSLVSSSDDHKDTRARAVLTDPAIIEVAQHFADSRARLVVTNIDDAGNRIAEVSHESLIRYWKRLRVWTHENRANLRTRTDVAAARSAWLEHRRDPTLLIPPGIRLEAARQLYDDPGEVSVGDLSDYIEASIENYRRMAEEQFRRAEAERQTAAHAKAAMIWARFKFKEANIPASAVCIQALWDLAGADCSVHNAFVGQLSITRYNLERLVRGPAAIARTFGLRPDPETMQRLLIPVLAAIAQTTEPDQLRALAESARTLVPKLGPEQRRAAVGNVLDAIRHSALVETLPQAVRTSGAKLNPDGTHVVLGTVLFAIPQTAHLEPYFYSHLPRILAQALPALAPTPQQAKAYLDSVLAATSELSIGTNSRP